jgi:hypothetical protein
MTVGTYLEKATGGTIGKVSDMDTFTYEILRDVVRNSVNEVASSYVVEDFSRKKRRRFWPRCSR